jgi:hypothetical protein
MISSFFDPSFYFFRFHSTRIHNLMSFIELLRKEDEKSHYEYFIFGDS